MADEPKGDANVAGGAAKRPDVGDKQAQSGQSGSKGAGSEPNRSGRVPEEHTEERQSNYGGGGANGGASGDAKGGA
jgi:hypothetical protein